MSDGVFWRVKHDRDNNTTTNSRLQSVMNVCEWMKRNDDGVCCVNNLFLCDWEKNHALGLGLALVESWKQPKNQVLCEVGTSLSFYCQLLCTVHRWRAKVDLGAVFVFAAASIRKLFFFLCVALCWRKCHLLGQSFLQSGECDSFVKLWKWNSKNCCWTSTAIWNHPNLTEARTWWTGIITTITTGVTDSRTW